MEDRLVRAREIYDNHIMKELLSCSHVSHPHIYISHPNIYIIHPYVLVHKSSSYTVIPMYMYISHPYMYIGHPYINMSRITLTSKSYFHVYNYRLFDTCSINMDGYLASLAIFWRGFSRAKI